MSSFIRNTNRAGAAVAGILMLALAISMSSCGREHIPSVTPESISAGAGVPVSADGKINLNNMTRIALQANFPGIDDRMIYEFFEYQPYDSIQTFRDKLRDDINASELAEYEKSLFVPIDVNTPDQQTLMQIPGVTKDLANILKSQQPFKSHEAFFEALDDSLSIEQIEVAATYLRDEALAK